METITARAPRNQALAPFSTSAMDCRVRPAPISLRSTTKREPPRRARPTRWTASITGKSQRDSRMAAERAVASMASQRA